MKKVLKSLILASIVALMVVTLTGCNNKKDSIYATKHVDNDEVLGSYDEDVEVEFKDGKASKIIMSFVFKDEDNVGLMKSLYESSADAGSLSIRTDKNKFIMEMDGEAFLKQQKIDSEEDLNAVKEELKKVLEADGYTIK